MKPVFLDTVGRVAVWDATDQWHALAYPAYRRLLASGRPQVTTPLVFFECGNTAARRTYRADVVDQWVRMAARGRLIEPTPADVAAGWAAYRAGGPGAAGIEDQISFVVMRRLGLADVFGNDKHFTAAGFTCLF